MPFIYLIKRSMPPSPFMTSMSTSYLRPDGKFNGAHHEAKQYETREEAEAKAFNLIAKHSEWFGKLSVVRSAPF